MNDWQKLKRHKLEVPPSLLETTSHLQLPEVIGEKVDKRTLWKRNYWIKRAIKTTK